ncbi:MAG: enoyl-CoA hydratase/isomerase family protein [Deltaproteobacteria bacterium]|nr:enoyl-CoA hydratase/isomerase family protein [Deltaproteobacteria bacterium]
MKFLDCEKQDGIYIVTMKDGQNRIRSEVMAEHHQIMDQIAKDRDNTAVILTSSDEKFWCNGIDVDWLMQQPSEYFPEFTNLCDELILRWSLFDAPTIACITGHCYGGGAVVAACMDFRIMREDRGFYCFPEVDVHIPFTEVMHDVIELLPNKAIVHEMILTGRRVGGQEASSKDLVHACYNQEELFSKAMELATHLKSKDRATYSKIKTGLKKHLLKWR